MEAVNYFSDVRWIQLENEGSDATAHAHKPGSWRTACGRGVAQAGLGASESDRPHCAVCEEIVERAGEFTHSVSIPVVENSSSDRGLNQYLREQGITHFEIQDEVCLKEHFDMFLLDLQSAPPDDYRSVTCPNKNIVVSRLIEQCYGGTQVHYGIRMVDREGRNIVSKYAAYELLPWELLEEVVHLRNSRRAATSIDPNGWRAAISDYSALSRYLKQQFSNDSLIRKK